MLLMADVTLLMLSVFWSMRFFSTPMRSSSDCFSVVIWSESACTWVCSSTSSRFTASAGVVPITLAAKITKSMRRQKVFMAVPNSLIKM